ncbi:hypothetical protein ACFWPK_12430 [Nocardia sp. NPDC058519]|uniref:hypothetical protein n=1 Tax=Nocardia sp. NPDC058519 TaxID=3346535 RepID=UPI00365689F8
MKKISASLTFLTTEEGGRVAPARDGVRSQILIGDIMTSCVVRGQADGGVFIPGRQYIVELELLFSDLYAIELDSLKTVELYEGSKLVAKGARL